MPKVSTETASETIALERLGSRSSTSTAAIPSAFYVPPGHTPVHHAGAEIVEFSPTDALGETIGVVMGNLRAAGVEA